MPITSPRSPLAALALALILASSALAVAAAPRADAAAVFFPGPVAPPTQVAREMTLPQAAQAGVVQLSAKGGYNGDAVKVEVKANKRVKKVPVVLTIRVEWHVPEPPPGSDPQIRELTHQLIREKMAATEADFNGKGYKTRSGDPFRLKIDYRFRLASEPPAVGYHQAELLNPRNITPPLANPDDFRASAGRGVPNGYGDVKDVTFGSNDFQPSGITHEFLHLSGIADQYEDTYRVGGKTYALPVQDPSEAQLTAFRKTFTPPLKAGGKLGTRNLKTAGKCDVMGVDVDAPCHRMRQADIDWLADQAGVQVTALPGDVLLNKNEGGQDMGVGFTSIVFATPGSTTTANGLTVYCLDHDKTFPLGIDGEGFDVAPASDAVPGFGDVAKLLALSGELTTGLDSVPDGMQTAIWNVTDGKSLATGAYEDEARALMARAGVAEDANPGGVPDLVDPNGAEPTTAAVGADGVLLPTTESDPIKAAPSPIRVSRAVLYPNRVRAGRRARTRLLVEAAGGVRSMRLTLQRKRGRRWKAVRALGTKRFDATAGRQLVPLSLGRVARGRYRVAIRLSTATGAAASATVALGVR
ncbi:thioester domain-containing protein [Patulibacter defluvii]|uniref:thioester domain-containing protein n=1 Tax=Patulibacter defluvii TaxID=3095358 RepID=UPI002A7553D6|nr:thioester domain-containing protein [Patulibacter sp. DM4]